MRAIETAVNLEEGPGHQGLGEGGQAFIGKLNRKITRGTMTKLPKAIAFANYSE